MQIAFLLLSPGASTSYGWFFYFLSSSLSWTNRWMSLYCDSSQPCQLRIHFTKVISSVSHCHSLCLCFFIFLSVYLLLFSCLQVKALKMHCLSQQGELTGLPFSEQTDFCQDKFIALSFLKWPLFLEYQWYVFSFGNHWLSVSVYTHLHLQ